MKGSLIFLGHWIIGRLILMSGLCVSASSLSVLLRVALAFPALALHSPILSNQIVYRAHPLV